MHPGRVVGGEDGWRDTQRGGGGRPFYGILDVTLLPLGR